MAAAEEALAIVAGKLGAAEDAPPLALALKQDLQ